MMSCGVQDLGKGGNAHTRGGGGGDGVGTHPRLHTSLRMLLVDTGSECCRSSSGAASCMKQTMISHDLVTFERL